MWAVKGGRNSREGPLLGEIFLHPFRVLHKTLNLGKSKNNFDLIKILIPESNI